MGAHRFEPSDASFYGAPAKNAGGGLLDLVQDAFTSSNAAIAGWGALISAIEDPRERVATLKAKIANYERMRRKYGIGPLGDLYTNEIRLMKARLKAEKKGLVIQKEGEGAVWIWRIAGWGIAGGLALLLAAKAYAAVTSAPGTARVTNPGELARYTVTNADDLAAVGLPAYMLGTWEHYATNGGYVRLGRVSGKGSKFASFPVEDFDKAISVGLFVPGTARVANPWHPPAKGFPVGSMINYRSEWGHTHGRVLRNDGAPGKELLIQDYADNGAREWIPAADVYEVRPPRRRRNPAGDDRLTLGTEYAINLSGDIVRGKLTRIYPGGLVEARGVGSRDLFVAPAADIVGPWFSDFERRIVTVRNPHDVDPHESSRRDVNDLLTWLRTADDRQRIAAEMLEQYDADPNMGNSGVRFVLREWARVQNPRVNMDDVDPRERFQLASVPDGWAEVKDGRDRQAYKKWALCASRDGKKPLKRYTNGGPVGLLRPTSGKTERGPLWHHRAQGFVRLVGGLPLPGLYDVASWYSRHRAGTYPLTVD